MGRKRRELAAGNLMVVTLFFCLTFTLFFASYSNAQQNQQNKVEEILQTIREGDYEAIEKAKKVLKKMGSSALDSLLSALKDENDAVRCAVVEVLGEIKNPRAVSSLIDALKDDDYSVRETAAEALGKIKDGRAIKPLVFALTDPYWDVRKAAVVSLNILGWKPATAEEKVDCYIAQEKWDECVKMGSAAVARLITFLGIEGYGEEEKMEVVSDTLKKIGKPAAGPLIAALKSPDLDVCKGAAVALGKMKEKSALEALIPLLKNEDTEVRALAAEALGKIGSTLAVEPLIEMLKDQSNGVRKKAIVALGRINDSGAMQPLISLLTDEDSLVRATVAEVVGNSGDKRAVKPLLKSLKDPDADVRHASVEALGKINDPESIPYLVATLLDKDSRVRKKGAQYLDKSGWKPGNTNEMILHCIAGQDWGKCLKYGKESVDFLLTVLDDEDDDIRIQAIKTLGKIKDVRAVEPLISIIKEEEKSIRKAVVEALGDIGDKSAIPALVSSLRDWEVGPYAADSLKRLDWIPVSMEEKVHYWVARRWKKTLLSVWEQTKKVLLADVKSEEYPVIENALYGFIGLGQSEIITVLIETLKEEGTKTMAEAYLNCGHETLDKAAREWAQEHGYFIMWGGGYCPITWGGL